MEFVLKILLDGFSAVHVAYAYGFAIILLTVIVKVATLPLTKQQVESTLAMQNLQPKIKAIQERYIGNQVFLESFMHFWFRMLMLRIQTMEVCHRVMASPVHAANAAMAGSLIKIS